MAYRKLVPGDRARITGPQGSRVGRSFTGRHVTIIYDDYTSDTALKITIDGEIGTFWWTRQYLKAFPKRRT